MIVKGMDSSRANSPDNHSPDKSERVMECGGRAQRRHRFSDGQEAVESSGCSRAGESGVALRFPPQSKMIGEVRERRASAPACGLCHPLA